MSIKINLGLTVKATSEGLRIAVTTPDHWSTTELDYVVIDEDTMRSAFPGLFPQKERVASEDEGDYRSRW